MNSITINIHSFVDLITNSSTEIFVQADESTVSAIKELVNSILKIAKSDLSCDDLFDISLDKNDDEYNTAEVSVKPKIDDGNYKTASRILSNLTGLFNIDGNYNG